jgi:chemotaxis methyl-accepting protein methylase
VHIRHEQHGWPPGVSLVGRPKKLRDRASKVRELHETPKTATPAPEEHDPFAAWLLMQSSLNPQCYRAAPLQRRMTACLRLLKATTPQAARSTLRARPDLLPAALDAVLIGVSSFFRDREVFTHLRNTLLPSLVSRRGPLRVWSVGCSDGAELATVAMLLDELGVLASSRLLGTDCRAGAIQQAQRGVYAPWQLAELPPELAAKHFIELHDGRLTLRWPRAPKFTWRVQDAMQTPDEDTWDLILCRNLAIYLSPPAMERLWQLLASRLRRGGYLVVGKAERPPTLARVSRCIYTHRGEV